MPVPCLRWKSCISGGVISTFAHSVFSFQVCFRHFLQLCDFEPNGSNKLKHWVSTSFSFGTGGNVVVQQPRFFSKNCAICNYDLGNWCHRGRDFNRCLNKKNNAQWHRVFVTMFVPRSVQRCSIRGVSTNLFKTHRKTVSGIRATWRILPDPLVWCACFCVFAIFVFLVSLLLPTINMKSRWQWHTTLLLTMGSSYLRRYGHEQLSLCLMRRFQSAGNLPTCFSDVLLITVFAHEKMPLQPCDSLVKYVRQVRGPALACKTENSFIPTVTDDSAGTLLQRLTTSLRANFWSY